jgi:hypothetical protein
MFSLAFLVLLLHSLRLCFAVPFDARQANNLPQTVTTVNTAASSMGTVTVTCVIVLTPVTDAQGNDVVREVKTCTLAVNDSPSSSDSTSIVSPTTSTETLPDVQSTTTPAESTFSISTPTPIPTDDTGGYSTSFVTTPTIETPLDAGTPTSALSVQTSAAGISGIAVAAASSMPGTKLSVLPIGLGVFAGISVIALIVVGLVTYERTKYRKAFRQRKLAEAAAPLGYGGMEY